MHTPLLLSLREELYQSHTRYPATWPPKNCDGPFRQPRLGAVLFLFPAHDCELCRGPEIYCTGMVNGCPAIQAAVSCSAPVEPLVFGMRKSSRYRFCSPGYPI